ncbi:Sigma-24 [Chlamydia abortus]|nr:Sigma-24 [Chlamydia abortus]
MSGAHDKKNLGYPDNQGKQETLELIYHQFHSKIRKYLSMKVESDRADDLTQQVFLKATEKWPSFRKECSLFTWLFKIAQNTLKSISEAIRQGSVPSFQELNNDSWDFETMKGFQFSYKIIEFISKEYGLIKLNQLIRNPAGFQEIFHCTESEFHNRWVHYLKQQLSP